jgi:hypothetical protein
MTRLRNRRHELVAQALAEGKTRADAFTAGGFPWHRGNHNRLARRPDIVTRVEEIRKGYEQIVDLRKQDRGRLLIELARIACVEVPLRAAIAEGGPEDVPADQSVLKVEIRLEGVLSKHIEMRLLDDRGAITQLLRFENDDSLERRPVLDFSPAVPPDFMALEKVLRALLRNREQSETLENVR